MATVVQTEYFVEPSVFADGHWTITVQFSSTPVVGDLAALAIRMASGFVDVNQDVQITDSAGNTWSKRATVGENNSNRNVAEIWSAEIAATATPYVVTINMPGDQSWQSSSAWGDLYEISGVDHANLVAASWSAFGADSNNPSLALAGAGDGLLLACLTANFADPKTIQSGWAGLGGFADEGVYASGYAENESSVSWSAVIVQPFWGICAVELNQGGTPTARRRSPLLLLPY